MNGPVRPRLLVFNLAMDTADPVLGFTSRWVAALARRAERVDVVTMRAGEVGGLPANVRVFSLGKERGFGEPRRAVRFYRLVGGLVARTRYDASFAHMVSLFAVMAAPLLKARGIPIVTWHAHASLPRRTRLAYHLSDRVVTSVERAFAYGGGKRLVLGQGIDTAFFSPGPRPAGPPLVVHVGRLSPVKDVDTLVRAAALLAGDVRVALVGGAPAGHGAYEEHLRRLVASEGLEGTVTFVGPVAPDAARDWYRAATVHVNVTGEGSFDKTALEAMACGRPSVVVNESFRDTLGPWAPRLLVPARDPGALAGCLRDLLGAPGGELDAIGADLRARVVERHDLERLADRLMAVFAEVARR
jgi:glycosyltransferase involved in cell wall biosynthesis